MTFIAYKDFEYVPFPGMDRETVKAGEEFIPPKHWFRNEEHEQIVRASKPGVQRIGVAFTYQGAVINTTEKNPALQERRTHTALLPLEEREDGNQT